MMSLENFSHKVAREHDDENDHYAWMIFTPRFSEWYKKSPQWTDVAV
jgi:hypothetical protein